MGIDLHEKYDRRFMFYYLALIESIGTQTIKKIDSKLDNLSDILEYDENDLINKLELNVKQTNAIINRREILNETYNEYQELEESDISFVLYDDEDFPSRLKTINQSPAYLFVKGELPKNINPSVAIIGSRASTSYGTAIAEYFGEALANEGVDIISGMAVGIDAAGHRGALLSNTGKTFAVLGCGANIVYPKDNYYIYEKITEDKRGGIISEVPPNVPAISRNFPMRNRIISGLADIVLVVEAREKSGSLITVEYALDQGKDIMAVPGRISDPMSRGANELIANGARMANSPEDVLDCLNIAVYGEIKLPEKNIKLLDNTEKIVYSTLDSTPKHIDDIALELELSHQEVIEALVELELKGLISQVSSNYYGK